MIKLFANLRSYAWYLIASLVTVGITSSCDLLMPNYMSSIVSNGILGKDIDFIWRTGGVMLLISGISMLAAVLGSYCSATVGMGFGMTVRSKIFKKAEYFSQKEFDKLTTSSLITRTTNDVNQVQMLVIMGLRMMVSAPIMLTGGIIMAYRKIPSLTWIVFVILPFIVLIAVVVMRVAMPLFKLIQVKIDKINLILREKLSGIRVIRAFSKEEYEDTRFSDASKDLADTQLKAGKIMALMMPLMMFIMNMTSLLIIWFGAGAIQNPAEIGNLMAFISYVMQIMMSFMMATMMFIMVPRAQVSAERINEVLETDYSVTDSPNAKPPLRNTDGKKPVIEFRNISFTYEGANEPVISNISFNGKKGETIAIIGSTGSGKSTLVNLIPRFYDATEGEIYFHGSDIREIPQKDLRKNIGYIPQKAFLFDGTIEDNISSGNEGADAEQIRKALEISQSAEFVDELPDKEKSHISQGATNISGGQKQRLSIARALARKADLYIFDDTFSALDFKTDAKLRAAIKQNLTDACVIIVAQRVGTIMNADKIIALEDGKICGIGTHRELLENCEVYKEIVESQLTEEEMS